MIVGRYLQDEKNMTEKENDTKDLKFYSQKAIGIATFIGGSLAAGYLVRENYLSLNKHPALNLKVAFTT